MATTKITSPDLFDLSSLDSALQLPSGTTAQRPTSPSTGEWRYNTDNNLIEFYDGGAWRDLQDEDIPPTASENFSAITYIGEVTPTSTATQSITGLGFQPDIVWIKQRDFTAWHHLTDSSRGGTPNKNALFPNRIEAQGTGTQAYGGVVSYDSDGFTVQGGGAGANNVCELQTTYVAFCWKINAGTKSSNTDGTITSNVQVNNKTGTSIVEWTSASSGSNYTVGHGQSAAPELIIFKYLNLASNWPVYAAGSGGNNILYFDLTNAVSTGTNNFMNSVTSSTMSFGSDSIGGYPIIAYCFRSIAGYSKIGTYTGSGSTLNGTVVTTGFEPAFVMIKRTSSNGSWWLFDNKRNINNPRFSAVQVNTNVIEWDDFQVLNFLSDGFELTSDNGEFDASGSTYLYMAFASDPSGDPDLENSFGLTPYTGDGAVQHQINGMGFAPAYTWMHSRSFQDNNYNMDSLKGYPWRFYSNLTFGVSYDTNRFKIPTDDGFILGSDASTNQNGQTFMSWNWKSNRAVYKSNTNGTINSLTSAHPNAGFSIVQYIGDGTSSATVGHGLSSTPEMIIVKKRDGASSWQVHHSGLSANNVLLLNTTDTEQNPSTAFNNGGLGTVNATTFGFVSGLTDANNVNESGLGFMAYCFNSISGYSKIGSYTGTGSGNTQSINTGFAASYVLIKDYNVGGSWWIIDSARGGSVSLKANTDEPEQTTNYITFTSTGFDVTGGLNDNASGSQFIYLAIKENPAQPAIPSGEMAYLVQAGGGGGGTANGAGGGGAGGLRTSYGPTSGGGSAAESKITLAAGTYTITVGAGGTAVYGAGAGASGNNGVNSSLDSIVSVGGGGGAHETNTSKSGGCGGGAGTLNANSPVRGGAGTASQGYYGGWGDFSGSIRHAGGGGGTGQPATNGRNFLGFSESKGGDGLVVNISGSYTAYGGGGGGNGGSAGDGQGGAGGGGSSYMYPTAAAGASAGTANTGGGGGGGAYQTTGGNGASGIVILRMNTSDYSGVTTGSPTVTTVGTETILTYTGSGTYVHS